VITDKMLWDQYCTIKRMNPSTLVAGCKSMLSLRNLIRDGFSEETNAMRMGSSAHALLLEPQEFCNRFCVMPDFHLSPENVTGKGVPSQTRTTDWYKKEVALFAQDNPNKTIIAQTQYDQCLRAIDAIWARPKMRELVEASAKEVTVYGEICGIECKSRLDLFCGYPRKLKIGDLKNSVSVHKRDFGRTFMRLRYDFKLAFYRDMVRQNVENSGNIEVELITQELGGDFDNALVPVPAIVLDNAWSKVVEVMTAYKRCLETNTWPGVDGGKDYYELDIPNWAMPGDEEFDWSSTVEATDNEVTKF
jgi:hypothetical protein